MDNTKKIIIGAIAVVILLIGGYFIFNRQQTGVGQLPRGEVVARVNGEEISSNEVAELHQIYSQQGIEVSEEEILENLITQKLLQQAAKEKGYSISTEEAEEMIKTEMAMQEMTLDDFKQLIEAEGMSYDEQLEIIKEELAVQKYLEEQVGPDLPEISDQEVEEYYQDFQDQETEEDLPSFEELEPQIIAFLQQQKEQEAITLLIEELKSEAEIEYL